MSEIKLSWLKTMLIRMTCAAVFAGIGSAITYLNYTYGGIPALIFTILFFMEYDSAGKWLKENNK